MPRCLIAPAPLDGLEGEWRKTLLVGDFELHYPKVGRQMVEPELRQHLPGCKASLAGSEPYTRAVLEANPDLRVIARVGVGYDAVDLQAATEHGVVVTIAPGTNQDAVAEHAFLLILGLAKQIIPQHTQIIAGKWPRNANVPLRSQTLGIVGLGRIGKAVALRGLAFGMRVIVHEPMPDAAFVAQHSIPLLSLEEVMREADYLTLHAPMLPESHHMINKKSLGWMKRSAFLVNTSRGGLVNEADLYEILRERRIAGAGLDVFEEEPPSPKNPLFTLDNVLFTAHTAGVDWKSRDDMAQSAAQAIVDLSQGKWPKEKVVNPEVRSRFKW